MDTRNYNKISSYKKNLIKIFDIKIFYLIILFFFSIFINQYYGYLGINPIDSFFSFNSGYDILNGYFPFKDYWTITGPLIAFTQALFFKIFGVSWFSYVLQASIYNLLISMSTFYTLFKFKLKIHYCFFYSFLVSIIANTSSGTPYVDHQSAFLSIISLYCFILAIKLKENKYWFLLPIILVLSFLTKQAPTGHIFLIISLLSIFYFIFNFDIKKILSGLSGSVFIISIILLIFWINKIPIISFFQQYILFPLSLGESRLNFLFPLEFNRIVLRFKLIHLSSLILLILVLRNTYKNSKYLKTPEFLIHISLLATSYALIVHQLMTINGIFIFFIIPILTAFSHIYFNKYFSSKKYVLYALLLLSFSSTVYYWSKYIHQRDFMDLRNVDINKAIDAKVIDDKLAGLKWITTLYPDDPNKEILLLSEVIKIVNKDSRNKSIITDYQFISVILNTYDYSPSQVWFGYHVNPVKDSKYYNIYKEFFLNKIKKNKIEVVYTIKPLWGGNEVLEEVVNKKCFNKKSVSEILDIYIILKCSELN